MTKRAQKKRPSSDDNSARAQVVDNARVGNNSGTGLASKGPKDPWKSYQGGRDAWWREPGLDPEKIYWYLDEKDQPYHEIRKYVRIKDGEREKAFPQSTWVPGNPPFTKGK